MPDHFYRQSGVLAYRRRHGNLEILLITSRRGKRWVLPKGVIEPNLTARDSAVKEAAEEAGIAGNISFEPIGTYTYRKWQGTCTVEVFIMEVLELHEVWPESSRERRWFKPGEAASRIHESELGEIILEFAAGHTGEIQSLH